MKKLLIATIVFLGILATATAQTGCSKYYPFKEGTTAEITNYNKKGEKAGSINYTILNRTQTAEGEVATVKSSVKNEKGKLIVETDYDITCDGNKISVDYRSMVSPMMMEQFKNVEYDITGTDLEIPNNLSVGQSLPDANMIMKISMAGINMNMELSITNRKVTGKESITTPVGTFDCFIITSDMIAKMGTEKMSNIKQWIAEGAGMVKQEDYDSRGNVNSSSLLTKFSN